MINMEEFSVLESALRAVRMGFYVFPLAPNSKIPIKGMKFNEMASSSKAQVKEWFTEKNHLNYGIITSRYNHQGEEKALVVVDVDTPKGGDETLSKLEHSLPPTLWQRTASGGRHLIYVTDAPVKQGVHVLGQGVDIRSKGGYIVGFGSQIGGKTYDLEVAILQEAPPTLIEACGKAPTKKPKVEEVIEVDEKAATRRGQEYLEKHAPLALEGAGGNTTTYTVACHLKEIGVESLDAYELMMEHWNDRCEPPWDGEELARIVDHAYQYSQNAQGAESPEAHFKDVVVEEILSEKEESKKSDPVSEWNKRFVAVLTPTRVEIVEEAPQEDGSIMMKRSSEDAFHRFYQNEKMTFGDGKRAAISKLWMQSPNRRSKRGFVFEPDGDENGEAYNLWKGFHIPKTPKPDEKKAVASVEALKLHIHDNICQKDPELYAWLITWFASIIQKPSDKSKVALVFQGKKGTGKSIVSNLIGHLFGQYYLSVANRRYLAGNFNSHLEKCLLLTLDEAFWSGDKQVEGILKNLISEPHHVIERKGLESYRVSNYTRVIIVGNEEWLVSATDEERRFAVFEVGEAKMQNLAYFQAMHDGILKHGGDKLLYEYLKNWNCNVANINQAPQTKGLQNQKRFTRDTAVDWWEDSLKEGGIIGFPSDQWPKHITKRSFQEAYFQYVELNHIKHAKHHKADKLRDILKPYVTLSEFRPKADDSGIRPYCFKIPPLEEVMKKFEERTGQTFRGPLDE